MNSRALFGVLALCLVLCGVSWAQIKSSTVTGTVTDVTGAVVPGAEVIVTNQETNVAQTTITNSEGEFAVPYLAAGRYSVMVRKPGFAVSRQTGIVLGTAQTVRADCSLQAGQVESTVEVKADAAQLQTESATVQNSINENIIRAVPNITRNPFAYAALQPGVVGRSAFNNSTNVNSFGIGVDGRRFFSAISVNGAQAFSADVQVDGLSVQGSAWNEAAIIPNVEGLQEVKTITNSYSAEYGRGSGIIQLTTKSGTNEFHGSAFYRARNEAFNANTFGNNARGLARAPFKVHAYGASFGGPVWVPKLYQGKDRLFFFVSYEGLQHKRGLDFFRTVPTEAERVGDFSKTFVNIGGTPTPMQLFNPLSVTPQGNNVFRRAPIPGNDLRNVPNLIDPSMLRFFSFYPKPNRPAEDVFGTNNYYARREQDFSRNSINSRIDYKLGRHSLYGAWGINRGAITTPGAWGAENPFYNQSTFIGNTNSDDNPYGAVGLTYVFSPQVIADVRYGLTRIVTINKAYPGSEQFDYNPFGIPAAIQAINQVPNAPPEFQPGGNLSPLSSTGSLYKDERQTNHNLTGNVTWLRGRWTHKFGAENRVYLSNYDDPENSMQIITRQDFTREFVDTFGNGVGPTTAANGGWSPASMLMGLGRINVNGSRFPKPAFAQKYFAAYTQNDWRATDRLNLYIGLRWDLQPGLTDRFDRLRVVDLNRTNAWGAQGEYVFAGIGRTRNLYDTNYDNFGPRFGLAYRLGQDTVVRAGYGLTYLPSNTGFFATGGFYGMDAFSPTTLNDNAVAYGTSPNGVPVGRFNQVNVIVPEIGSDAKNPVFYGTGPFAAFPADGYKNANLQQWNLTVERKFGNNYIASVGYVGSKGSHLPYARLPINHNQFIDQNILNACRQDYITRNGTGNSCNDPVPNPYQPTTGSLINFGGFLRNRTVPRINLLQPYPFLQTNLSATIGWSNYHSFQASFTRQFARGLQFNVNYVWSKTLDFNQSEAQFNGFDDNFGFVFGDLNRRDLRQNYKPASTDIPHRVVASFVYDLPFGKGRQFDAGNGAANALIGGWKVSGVYNAQSGTPLQLGGGNTGSLNGRPFLDSTQPIEVAKELQRWYDSPNTADRTVTLPSGRRIIVCRFCFLKYNADIGRGSVIQLPNGNYVNDIYWFGNMALSYTTIRSFGINNFNFSLDRTFGLTEKLRLEFSAQATNFFNHTQFSPSFTRSFGGINVVNNRSAGLIPGLGSNDNYGTMATSTYDPRQIEFHLRVRF